jgi:beta-arrestin
MYAPSKPGDQPSVEVSKEFMMSPNKLHLECSLDKELYYHGETISVNVHIQNNSNKAVKKIKVSVRQFADICLFSTAQYKCTVDEKESEDGFPLGSGSTLSKVYELKPLLSNNKDKWGLALDGQLKHEDTNLASSTLIHDQTQKENLGIIVQYKVKVKLYLGPLAGELAAELPFTLMHPKPEPEPAR